MKRFALLALALVGCTDTTDGVSGTQSLQVAIKTPTNLGSVDDRLPETARTMTLDLAARDAQNEIDTSYTKQLRVYANFLGTLTPELPQAPLATIEMVNGLAYDAAVTLPESVLGPTTLWIDDGEGFGPDYVHGRIAGTSETLWFRDPVIRDLQRPRDETALDALSATPLQNKQIRVGGSRHGADGRLVVTSIYNQGYTVSDVKCGPGGAPPCTAEAYDHVLVFTFSAPRDQHFEALDVGQVVEAFTGGLTEFNGLTELGFPRTYVAEQKVVNPALMPAPVRFDPAWFGALSSPEGRINFERNESGAIEIIDGYVCPLDDDYATYKQWKVDPTGVGGANCMGDNVLNVITAGSSFTADPAMLVGKKVPRLVGIVRPVSIGSFNVWIIYPRGAADIDLP